MALTWLTNALSTHHHVKLYTISDNSKRDAISADPTHWGLILSWNNSIFEVEPWLQQLKHHPKLQFIFLDCPLLSYQLHVKDNPEHLAIWEQQTLWCYDAFFVDYLREQGFPNTHHFPHPTYQTLTPDTPVTPTNKRPNAIAYVGSINNPLTLRIEKDMKPEAKAILKELKDACYEHHMAQLNHPFYNTYMQVLNECGGIAFIANDIQAYYFYFAALVHCTYALRQDLIHTISKQHPITVYNKDTLTIPKECQITQSTCNSVSELFHIYDTSKLCLNVPHLQQVDGLNQRYFNATAMGAYLISPTPGMETPLWGAISQPNQHFTSLEKAIECVQTALQTPNLTDKTQPQRNIIRTQHSPQNRADLILKKATDTAHP